MPAVFFSLMTDLAAALAEDLDAHFPSFVDAYASAVYTVALRLCGRADAEDLAQETFERAFADLRRSSTGKVRALCLRPWVLTIALNVARNHLRAEARHPRSPLTSAAGPTTAAANENTADDRTVLAAALLRLPLPARQAVVLRHVVGCSTDETARILGRPTGTVKAQVSRGLATLRTYLEAQESD